MDRKYSPLAPLFTIWTSRHKIVFSGHFSALFLLSSDKISRGSASPNGDAVFY